jgi:release factor glutamine methyltransferase
MVTIEKLIKDGLNIIKQREFNSPRLEVELILCYLLQKDRIYLHLNGETRVSQDIAEKKKKKELGDGKKEEETRNK